MEIIVIENKIKKHKEVKLAKVYIEIHSKS